MTMLLMTEIVDVCNTPTSGRFEEFEAFNKNLIRLMFRQTAAVQFEEFRKVVSSYHSMLPCPHMSQHAHVNRQIQMALYGLVPFPCLWLPLDVFV